MTSARSSTTWWRTALLLLCVNAALFTLGALLLEGGLRVSGPDWLALRMRELSARQNPPEASDRAWKTEKREGKFLRFVPGSRFDVVHAEYQHVAHIDELGGRTVGHAPRNAPLLPVVGDSFTFGVGVEDDETFVSLLQRDLPSVRLLNLGVPGSGPQEQRFIVAQRHEELGRPRRYLWCIYLGNDLHDLLLRGAVTVPNARLQSASKRVSRLNAAVSRGPLARSYAVQYVRTLAVRAWNAHTPARQVETFYLTVNTADQAYAARAAEAFRREALAWRDLAHERGFEVTAVLLPHRAQLLREQLETKARGYGFAPDHLDSTAANRIVMTALHAAGLNAVDTTDALRRVPNPVSLYFVGDDHFTARGHAQVAKVLRARIFDPAEATAPGGNDR